MTASTYEVLVGTFGPNILHFRYETASGRLQGPLAVSPAANASWIISAGNGTTFYAVNEEGAGAGEAFGGSVAHLRHVLPYAPLSRLANAPSLSDHPTHCSRTGDDRHLAVANYAADGGGALCLIELDHDGALGQPYRIDPPPYPTRPGSHPERQASSHVHCAVSSPDGQWLFEADLGHDQVRAYALADIGRERPNAAHTLELPPGTGPRHLLFSKDGRFAWLTLELSGQVMTLAHHDGQLHPLQTLTLAPAGFLGQPAAGALHASDDGRFLYVVNRGDDNHLYVFECEPHTGLLIQSQRVSTRGAETREFALAPDGRFVLLANQNENAVRVFTRDVSSGRIGACVQTVSVDAPACFVFLEDGDGQTGRDESVMPNSL